MTDGYALIEIAPNGKKRLKNVVYLDVVLENEEIECKDVEEQLIDQLPDEFSDALVMVFFIHEEKTFKTPCGEWENEGIFKMVSFRLLKENYKAYYCNQVTVDLQIGIMGHSELEAMILSVGKENNYYAKIVEDWESLYNEAFVPSESDEESKDEQLYY